MIVIAGHLSVAPHKYDEFAAACKEITARTLEEEGCLFYEFWSDLDRSGRFSVVEAWASEEAFQAHITSPHLVAFREKRNAIGMDSVDFKRYEIAEVKPL